MPEAIRKIGLKLDVENIGPHYNGNSIHLAEDVDSLKAIFYASNGIGKSFISRTFRLMSDDKEGFVADDLLTLGQTFASLELGITPNSETQKKLSISLSKGNPATIQNDTGYLFHVFNSEFVEENIKSREYTPDGNIDGYILGKVQIDLTEERKQEALLEKEIEDKDKEINNVIDDAQRELRDNGIRANQQEYSLINKERLRNSQQISCDRTFDEILTQLNALEKLPSDLDDIVLPTFQADTSALEEVPAILATAYSQSDWDEEFALSVKSKRAFIEHGLELIDRAETCPFCEQSFSADALTLIQQYKAFLTDKEAQTIKQIESIAQRIEQIVSEVKEFVSKTKLANAKAIEIAKYFPSLKDTLLSIPDVSGEQLIYFEHVITALQNKSVNISKIDQEVNSAISDCLREIENVKKTGVGNLEIARHFNAQKNDSTQERLRLRRNLCNAQYIRTQTKLAPDFKLYADKVDAYEKLKESIKKKEEQERVSKKDKVYETLEYWLNRFFAGKYTIDKDTFFIRFLGASHPKASAILSDGEKSIVAYCLYLASTHLLMQRDDDYNKLFFIIDDPISSMDFNFVYNVAQSLRDIKEYFDIERVRLFLFTHNLEFFSIVTRNHTISQAYVMKPGKIETLKKQLLMPYESHLFDIVNIANGQEMPSHTTGNSIRHVLETVSKFEYPERKLEKYIAENDTLKDNSCVFSLCQDLSHGAMRVQPPFDEQVLIEACKVVVSFMEQRYHGQTDSINGVQTGGQA